MDRPGGGQLLIGVGAGLVFGDGLEQEVAGDAAAHDAGGGKHVLRQIGLVPFESGLTGQQVSPGRGT